VAPKAGALAPYALRCESLTDPFGVGREKPNLSWKLKAAKEGLRDLRQSAYAVRVGTAPGRADLWNSGRVVSSAQYGVTYGGKPLGSGRQAYWSVRTWDGSGHPSAWSPVARFSVGLLKESDWKGKWIAYDVPEGAEGQTFAGASWIWSAADGTGDAPVVKRTFTKGFTLAAKPATAPFAITADDAMTLWVNGREVYRSKRTTDEWRTPVRIDLKDHLRAGENEIRVEVENTTKSPAGVIARLAVGGTTVVTDRSWTTEGGVRIVAAYGGGPWGRFGEGRVLRPSVVYRKRFGSRSNLVRATADVTALGLVDFYLNGKRVTDDLFTPGWTDYHKRVYARTFDVTRMLASRTGNNVALEVGDGWYSGYVGFGAQRSHYGDRPRVRAQITLEYADGTKETIGTDGSWNAMTGARRVQDFLAGEEYDARLIGAGDPFRPTFRRVRARVIDGIKTKVEPFPGVPVRPYARLNPVKVTPQGGGYILDFGQNLAGFAHLKASGRAGERVQLQFVEVLNPDGTPYTANLRSARAIDAYTFAGEGVEEWEPRFTFHGFRYLKVTGMGRAPKPGEITAVAISSDTPETGTIETSDPMINKLAKNAWWTQKMNFIDVPTDCPQRDERLGWTGDAQAYIRTASTYSDVQSFFDKWLVALDDGQRRDGQYPQVAPNIVAGDDGGPAWADAGVICPKTIYDVYGDKRLLAERYPQMRKFVEFCRARSTPDLLPPRNFHCFGDWLSINASTPNEVIYEAYFAYSTRLLAQSARELGYRDDAAKYEKLSADVKAAFNRAYVSKDGKVSGDTQTAYVLALGFDLLEKPMRPLAAARLVANIQSRGWHLSTGFVGTRDLMRVLTEIGRDDVAFRLLHNTTFPSWGFEIKNGATTVWERWDGYTPEKGFQDPGMNSFAHYAYGAVMGWVFANVGGIDNSAPGFARIKIAPKIDPRLRWAKTSYDSVRGPVRTEWRKANGKVTLAVEIPPNATATIAIPGGGTKNVGSGTYRFVTAWRD